MGTQGRFFPVSAIIRLHTTKDLIEEGIKTQFAIQLYIHKPSS